MSATDELRRLLDERGVEWQDFDGEPTWMGSDGEMHYARQEFTFYDLTDNVTVYHLTPEQAVEATLGRGECEMEYVPDWMGWHCKSCDNLRQGLRDQKPRYCPNCGRKVVDA